MCETKLIVRFMWNLRVTVDRSASKRFNKKCLKWKVKSTLRFISMQTYLNICRMMMCLIGWTRIRQTSVVRQFKKKLDGCQHVCSNFEFELLTVGSWFYIDEAPERRCTCSLERLNFTTCKYFMTRLV